MPVDFDDRGYWGSLGFIGGLEIHQQLDTKKKLFCRCPVGYQHGVPDARILRHMRPTLSEMGEYDGTALMEFKTRKNVIYELYSEATCSYEMDDTPPFPLNREALEIAIEIALLLNCSIVDEVHVTRKQYLDGSIPTGFQRTLIVGVDGWIPFRGRKLTISQVNLEEDACREMSDIGHTIVFRTDRLSTPLVEIITGKELLTPQEMFEANRELARVLRVSGRVRRGPGAARQDVNVSIKGGSRVEIKGVDRYQSNRMLTANEALRQKALLDLRDDLSSRGLSEVSAHKRVFSKGEIDLKTPILSAVLEQGQVVGVVRLENMAGVFGRTLIPGRTFGHEVADRVKVIACIDTRPNLLHTDMGEEDVLLASDWKLFRRLMGGDERDLLAVTFGSAVDVETALEEIVIRVKELFSGVPLETRQDLGRGLTGFERILPGPDRMYPDTDSEPVRIEPELVERIKASLPQRPWEREEFARSLGVDPDLSRRIADSPWYSVFKESAQKFPSSAVALASIYVCDFPALAGDGVDVSRISPQAVEVLAESKVARCARGKWLSDIASFEPDEQISRLKSRLKKGLLSGDKLKRQVVSAVESVGWCGSVEKTARAAMGRVMKISDGLVDIAEALRLASEAAKALN